MKLVLIFATHQSEDFNAWVKLAPILGFTTWGRKLHFMMHFLNPMLSYLCHLSDIGFSLANINQRACIQHHMLITFIQTHWLPLWGWFIERLPSFRLVKNLINQYINHKSRQATRMRIEIQDTWLEMNYNELLWEKSLSWPHGDFRVF